jgi:dienelactone hydrolase
MGKHITSYMRAVLGAALIAACASSARAVTVHDIVFTDYTPLTSNAEMARRFLSPLEAAQIPALTAKSGKTLREQPVDLTQEKFVIYMPVKQPAKGYGLFVFVPPWDSENIPVAWPDVFEEHGIIFVSAAQSGNDQNPLGRREPLALLAEQNVVQHYSIDPARIYLGGFSGGARVALRIALAYPDLFRGVILNSGSDPIGNHAAPIPPKDLFAEFQNSTRLIFVTGDDEPFIRQTDIASRRSLTDWCVFHTSVHSMPSTAHSSMSAEALSRAFDELDGPMPAEDSARLASCRSDLQTRLDGELHDVEALIAGGKHDDAVTRLDQIDQQYGGLAAPRTLELQLSLAPK